MKNKIKRSQKWTVLIYANGNNEFEPEMFNTLLEAEKIGSSNEVNIVVQLSRVSQDLVKILRPEIDINSSNANWTGARRYYVHQKSSELVGDLGNLNMADPRVLYDFVSWGINNYPAENYMLVMGGHCFEYLGVMNDYSQNLPYIMGIPEMSKALSLVKQNTKQSIDILVMDTCYMNVVEVLYELGKDKNKGVEYVLTYIEHGPIAGLPIDKLINNLQDMSGVEEKTIIIEILIKDLGLDLVGFYLDSKKLGKIKRISNDLAEFLSKEDRLNDELGELIFTKKDVHSPIQECVNNLRKNMEKLIIGHKRVAKRSNPLVTIASKKTNNKLASYYARLSFTKNNKWIFLLGKQFANISEQQNSNIFLRPMVLPLQALVTLVSVMHPRASEEELDSILNELFKYKKWDQYTNYKLK